MRSIRQTSLTFGLVLSLCVLHSHAQTTITNLGVIDNGSTFGNAVSGDGTLAGGVSNGRPFIWSQSTGLRALAFFPGAFSGATHGISRDGSTATGLANTVPHTMAFRWVPTGGPGGTMTSLGLLPGGTYSRGYAVSATGDVIVGEGDSSASGGFERAWRWTSTTGMQDLGVLPGGTRSFAYGVSDDGNVVVGYSNMTGGLFHAFRWSAQSGMVDLGVVGNSQFSRANGVSADGNVVVGVSGPFGFRWTAARGMQPLTGVPAAALQMSVSCVSGHGEVVGGNIGFAGINHAMIWNAANGVMDLNTYLPSLGVDLTGWVLYEVRALSHDGTAAVGYGRFNGEERGFLVRGIPPACDPLDFNNDGIFPDTADVEDFLSMFGGGSCSTNNCNDLDFNNDGIFPDVEDVAILINVFNGGPCR